MERARTVMVWVGAAYVASGIAFAAISLSPEALGALIAAVLPGTGATEGAGGLMTAVAGGLTAGMGAVMIVLGRTPAIDLRLALRVTTVGLLTWFVIDSGGSIAHGAWRNAVGNAVFLAIGLLPVMLAPRAERVVDRGYAAG